MNSFTILGIDPGTNTGVSIYTLDNDTFEIIDIFSYTIWLNNLINPLGNVRRDRLFELKNKILHILQIYQPLVVAYEAPFVNNRFPKSAIYLTEYTTTLCNTINDFNSDILIYSYAPKEIKYYIGATGKADKNDMFNAISNINEITKFINIKELSEHSIDSLAIGYIMCKEIQEYPTLLLT